MSVVPCISFARLVDKTANDGGDKASTPGDVTSDSPKTGYAAAASSAGVAIPTGDCSPINIGGSTGKNLRRAPMSITTQPSYARVCRAVDTGRPRPGDVERDAEHDDDDGVLVSRYHDATVEDLATGSAVCIEGNSQCSLH